MLYPEVAVSVFQAEIGQHASTSEGFLAWKESEQWLIAWHEKECVLDDLILHWWLWLQRYRSTTTMQRTLLEHSCRQASFLSFCLCGRPAIYTIYVPYISCIYSMYIYNYIHTWRAARNVERPPANNYVFEFILNWQNSFGTRNDLLYRCPPGGTQWYQWPPKPVDSGGLVISRFSVSRSTCITKQTDVGPKWPKHYPHFLGLQAPKWYLENSGGVPPLAVKLF